MREGGKGKGQDMRPGEARCLAAVGWEKRSLPVARTRGSRGRLSPLSAGERRSRPRRRERPTNRGPASPAFPSRAPLPLSALPKRSSPLPFPLPPHPSAPSASPSHPILLLPPLPLPLPPPPPLPRRRPHPSPSHQLRRTSRRFRCGTFTAQSTTSPAGRSSSTRAARPTSPPTSTRRG